MNKNIIDVSALCENAKRGYVKPKVSVIALGDVHVLAGSGLVVDDPFKNPDTEQGLSKSSLENLDDLSDIVF